jgi:type IV pilus assembly protein PilV
MRNERGFTLISVLLAVCMLMIGLLALARTQAVLTQSENGVASRAVALAIATDRLEQLRGSDPATLANEGPMQVDANGAPSATGPYQRSVTVTPDAANLLRLTVSVTYPRMTSAVQLQALIYRRTS